MGKDLGSLREVHSLGGRSTRRMLLEKIGVALDLACCLVREHTNDQNIPLACIHVRGGQRARGTLKESRNGLLKAKVK